MEPEEPWEVLDFELEDSLLVPCKRAAQLAMQRKLLMGVGEEPTSTQEYIRRVVEDPCVGDEDFSRDPRLSAVDFVRRQGLVGSDGLAIGTSLSRIKNGTNMDKVSQDPVSTMDASIHHIVLN